MAKILIINEQNAHRAPRLSQLYEALSKEHTLYLAGDKKPHYVENSAYYSFSNTFEKYYSTQPIAIRIKRFLSRKKFDLTHAHKSKLIRKLIFSIKHGPRDKQFEDLSNQKFDLIINHHLYTLPLAIKLGNHLNIPVMLNAHEYYPSQMSRDQKNVAEYDQKMNYICSKYVPKTQHIFTVSHGIGKRYKAETGVNYTLIRNDKPYIQLEPSSNDKIKLVHHGAAHPLRNIDKLITMMDLLDSQYELHLILVGDKTYIEELQMLSKGRNIYFHEPVSIPKIPVLLNQFDIALFLFEPKTFNLANVLPNKFFESIQGRLAIITGPSPDMAQIVKDHELGIVINSFESSELAQNLNEISMDDIGRFKLNSHKSAKELSSESSHQLIKKIVCNLTGS